MLISLFLTFHVLYDSAVYNIQAAHAVSEHHHRLSLLNNGVNHLSSSNMALDNGKLPLASAVMSASSSVVVPSSNQISHPMVFPSNRVHFPKTSRRLPQVSVNWPNWIWSMNGFHFLFLFLGLGSHHWHPKMWNTSFAGDAVFASSHTESRRRGALFRSGWKL